ncbi:hypothetical protein QR680_010158 [Steinernema hermaphroditum]|uniref:7TM GPCR serpentine receptor class x (Srx) domain-containing protein n=1 Tax=Steinernema hermaphroditum TaxID=289476 RepID=A0AA39IPW1_9BILA|nr:hypothetical protein QR680_010158 [Steinernema hermaphroditum]
MQPDNVLVGLIYGVECLLVVPLHLLIVVILLKGKEFRKPTAYRIMTHMSIIECIQMLGYLFGSIMSFFQSQIHPYFGRIGGAILSAGWIGIILFTFLLTVNRLIVFSDFKISKLSEKKFFNWMLRGVWVTAALIFGIHLIPALSMVYIIERNTYWFEGHEGILVGNLESYFIYAGLFVTFILCMACVVMIIVKRNLFSTQFKVSSGELKLFCQCFVIFLYLTVIRCMWQFGHSLGVLKSEASYIVLGMATEAVGGVNPFLYLLLNRSIRGHVATIFRLHKSPVSSFNVSKHYKIGAGSKSPPRTP